ncbi:hypothetical protein [Pseudomonas sp. TE3610]
MGFTKKKFWANDNARIHAEKPGFKYVIDWQVRKAKDDDPLQGFAPPFFCNFLSIKRHPGHLPPGASFSMEQAALYTVPVQLTGADRGCLPFAGQSWTHTTPVST